MLKIERFILRSPTTGWFVRGVLVGLIGPGLVAYCIFVSVHLLDLPLPLGPTNTGPYVSMMVPDPELKYGLSQVLSGQAILVIGSSEVSPAGGGESLDSQIRRCGGAGSENASGASIRFLEPTGSAAMRTAVLLQRLGPLRNPVKLVVLANYHYATSGVNFFPSLSAYFPNSTSIAYYGARHHDSALFEIPEFRKELSHTNANGQSIVEFWWGQRRLEFVMFRGLLGSRIVQPLRFAFKPRSLPSPLPIRDMTWNAEWGVASPFVPRSGELSMLRSAKEIAGDETGAWARSLRLLAQGIGNLPTGSRVEFLLLPLNRLYYHRLGLDSDRMHRNWLNLTNRGLGGLPGVHIRDLGGLSQPADFHDSIHWNERGRERLAAAVCNVFPGDPEFR